MSTNAITKLGSTHTRTRKLRNIAAVLEAADASLQDVVSCLVHLADMAQWAQFNAAYEKHFPASKPVRTTVGAALLKGMLVEITVIAHRAR